MSYSLINHYKLMNLNSFIQFYLCICAFLGIIDAIFSHIRNIYGLSHYWQTHSRINGILFCFQSFLFSSSFGPAAANSTHISGLCFSSSIFIAHLHMFLISTLLSYNQHYFLPAVGSVGYALSLFYHDFIFISIQLYPSLIGIIDMPLNILVSYIFIFISFEFQLKFYDWLMTECDLNCFVRLVRYF